MEILTWAQRKTIIQTQLFVSVVSKVISDGIFTMNVFKNKKTLEKKIKKR